MSCSRRVLSELNGDWEAAVVFVAEAPGRLGAEKTGIPLFGDRTGDRFDEILQAMGLDRSSVFITNAILCNPRNEKGNNDSPKISEIRNCSKYLRRTIETVNPKFVVALGRVALEALKLIRSHKLTVRENVGQINDWDGRRLVALYHPAPERRCIDLGSCNWRTPEGLQSKCGMSHSLSSATQKVEEESEKSSDCEGSIN